MEEDFITYQGTHTCLPKKNTLNTQTQICIWNHYISQLNFTLSSSIFFLICAWCHLCVCACAHTPSCTPPPLTSQIPFSLSWHRHSYFCMLKLHQWRVVSFKWPLNKQLSDLWCKTHVVLVIGQNWISQLR